MPQLVRLPLFHYRLELDERPQPLHHVKMDPHPLPKPQLPALAHLPPAAMESPPPPTQPRKALTSLSERQLQVLQGLVEGKSNKEIAHTLQLSEGTVKMHIAALFRQLGATNRTHAAALGKQMLG